MLLAGEIRLATVIYRQQFLLNIPKHIVLNILYEKL